MSGRFITFEGIDGAGKSSHVSAAAGELRALGFDVLETREPGGTELAEAIRGLLLGRDMAALTEALLVFAARHDHLQGLIRPALAQGTWVVCDRFTDSSFAYQGDGRGLPREDLEWLAARVLGTFVPDRTYWFDLDPAAAAGRVRDRSAADRFEREREDFFARVAHGYARIAADAPQRVMRIDARESRTHIQALIAADLRALAGR